MKIELSKPISKLLRELPSDWEPKSWIITVDNIENMIGNHEILDGNHRMAVLIDEDRITEAMVYAVDYEAAKNLGFWDDCKDQENFEKWVIATGKIITDYETI